MTFDLAGLRFPPYISSAERNEEEEEKSRLDSSFHWDDNPKETTREGEGP